MVFPISLVSLVFAIAIASVDCNIEGKALSRWKDNLVDPDNVLRSWDPTLENPCTWYHVTCDLQNRVTRVDLGNVGLSGKLVPQLGDLSNLQHFEAYGNKLSGVIPPEFGNLKALISLNLSKNQLSGTIPSSLGNLASIRFLRLNSNKLTGKVPAELLQLVSRLGNSIVFDVSDNQIVP